MQYIARFPTFLLKQSRSMCAETTIRCVTTGHIHITSDDNIKKIDIEPTGLKHIERNIYTGIEKDNYIFNVSL